MDIKKPIMVLGALLFFVGSIVGSEVDINTIELIELLVVFLLGLHFVYGYIFGTEIHLTGYTVPAEERPILRVFIFITGIGIMLGTITYIL